MGVHERGVESVLKQLDLAESEAKLYRTLLREGKGTASHIAKKAGIGRRLAYDKFSRLVDRGLVSYVDRDNKRIYKPVNPKRLEEIVAEKRNEIENLENRVQDILPGLMNSFNRAGNDREVKILEGKSGIKQLFEDELREAEDQIRIIGSPVEAEEMLEHFIPSWTRRRAKKGIAIKGVFEHSMRGMLGEREATTKARYLPEDYNSNVSIAIYGDKAGIVFWLENPLVIMIEDSEASKSFESYFKLVWEAAEE